MGTPVIERRLAAVAAALLLFSTAAQAQEEKAEISVTSFRNDAVVVKYEYVFKEYEWAIMSYELAGQDEVTYRRPANLPGCNLLKDWGIDQGRFSVSTGNESICTGPLSICDTTNYTIEVHPGGCKWRKAN